ncbi:MAG: CHAT domain-containing protein [Aphanocapsa sp. GSE-SYN-MK-11-07L]|jgi:filamentous hemagglutinin family protein|nr:CHAT domain-containing protein [Aphanocapsa sp. GSE-SYN-MK-11-07L]
MKAKIVVQRLLLISLLSSLTGKAAQAQPVAAPNTTGTNVTVNGDRYDIGGGQLSADQANLFHNFSQFGLSKNQIANFLSNPQIQNILAGVSGGNPSIINGLIQVSGGQSNLYLMNPAGIVFGANASLNVPAAFIATTANGIGFGNGWFSASGPSNYSQLVGNPIGFAFTVQQPGAIINAGDLSVGSAQRLALIGGTVVNTGELNAPAGQVILAAVPGESFVRLSQTGQLLSLEFQPLSTLTSQPNAWTIPVLSLPQLLTGPGADEATGVTVNPDGTVQLTGGEPIAPTTGLAIAAGRIDVSSSQVGGTVQVLGDQVQAIGANINASGLTGGGKVLIGGDYQGQGSLPTTQQTTISPDSIIQADALKQGNGGQVVVWSDGTTRFSGQITAKGGVEGGNGGLVETSGKQSLQVLDATVNASAPAGLAGTWLLDPTDITIAATGGRIGEPTVAVSAINTALNQGTSVVITTNIGEGSDAGNITQLAEAPISYTGTAADVRLVLEAANDITLNGGITASNGPLNVTLNAQSTAGGNPLGATGAVNLNAPVSTNGGSFTATGQTITSASGANIETTGGNIDLNSTGQIDTSRSSLSTGVSTGNAGSITLTALANMTTANLSSAASNGTGGGIGLSTTGGSINTTAGSVDASGQTAGGNITFSAVGPITTAALTSTASSGTGGVIDLSNVAATTASPIDTSGGLIQGGQIKVNASGNIVTASLTATGTTGERITLVSNPGSITASTGSFTTSGADVQLLAGQNIAVTSITTDGGDIVLDTTQGSITVSGTLDASSSTNGGSVGLEANQGSINVDGINSQANSSPGTQGAIAILANQDITVDSITTRSDGTGATVSITSQNGAISLGSTDLGSNFGQGASINISAANNIQINGTLFADAGSLNGGTIQITSQNGSISTDNLVAAATTSFGLSGTPQGNGGRIALQAATGITTGDLSAFAELGTGGTVTLNSGGNTQVNLINAQGGTSGTGGTINVSTGQFFQATSDFTDQNGLTTSLSSAGATGDGSISIRHGGILTPFIVGDASSNGTAAAISTGANNSILPTRSFLGNFQQGNIRILNGLNPTPAPPPSPNPSPTPVQPQPVPPSSPLPIFSLANTLAQVATDLQGQQIPFTTITNLATPALVTAVLYPGAEIALTQIDTALAAGNIDQAILLIGQVWDQQFEDFFGQSLGTSPLSIAGMQDVLKKITLQTGKKPAIVYVLSRPEQLELLLVTPEGKPIHKTVTEANRATLLAMAKTFTDQVKDPRNINSTSYLKSAQQLYGWLIQPLAADLQAQNINTIAFAMDAGLRSLPVAALHNGQQFLVEQYSLGLMPSINLTDTRYRNIRRDRILAMGSSEFSDQAPLPSVPVEVATISQDLGGGQSLLNQDFTVANLEAQRQRQKFGVIHLATHGSFDPGTPSDSYIQFFNGKLQLNQLRELNLNQPPTELLTLSACRSAIGNEQAELGFAGLAVQAGVKTAVASLWFVSDEGTLGLMTEFYNQLATAPIKAEALRQAQIAMLQGQIKVSNGQLQLPQGESIALPPAIAQQGDRVLSHPYYWSAFTMIGSPW